MMKKLLLSAATAAGLLAPSMAYAQTVSGILDVVLEVQDQCTVSGGGSGGPGENPRLNFGVVQNPAGITAPVDGSTEVSIGGSPIVLTCNSPFSDVQLVVGGGDASSGGTRRLTNKDTGSDFLPYQLFLDPGRTRIVPIDTALTIGKPAGPTPVSTINIYGRIAQANINTATSGSHSDTLSLTFTF